MSAKGDDPPRDSQGAEKKAAVKIAKEKSQRPAEEGDPVRDGEGGEKKSASKIAKEKTHQRAAEEKTHQRAAEELQIRKRKSRKTNM